MKQLNFYKKRELLHEDDIFNYLMTTFKKSIFSWDYFVDFQKVLMNVKDIESELKVLNSLLGISKSEIKFEFLKLLEQYPKIRRVLPILIASRVNKIETTPIINNQETLESTKYERTV